MERINFRYVFIKNGEFGGYMCNDIDTVHQFLDEIFSSYNEIMISDETSIVCDNDIWEVFDNDENCNVKFNFETKIVIRELYY